MLISNIISPEEGVRIPVPVSKWPLEINPNRESQLTTLGNYLEKENFTPNQIESVKYGANMVPNLESMNMKLFSKVISHLSNFHMANVENFVSLVSQGIVNDVSLDLITKSVIPDERSVIGKKLSEREKSSLYLRFRAESARYFDLAITYVIYENISDGNFLSEDDKRNLLETQISRLVPISIQ
jgi:hypothetical protein